ncbi:hypothetical protein H6P81_010138 [Aristolochia fimbriata]|uniref:Uncharacterized protein n=1 Tax=Aristolochia fimbriata TaxID=158543 RepID=A0AAV7EMW0_ARIFI|nr:hypothetical protein H6P81_010138 [Aristolochia fimbriata]
MGKGSRCTSSLLEQQATRIFTFNLLGLVPIYNEQVSENLRAWEVKDIRKTGFFDDSQEKIQRRKKKKNVTNYVVDTGDAAVPLKSQPLEYSSISEETTTHNGRSRVCLRSKWQGKGKGR